MTQEKSGKAFPSFFIMNVETMAMKVECLPAHDEDIMGGDVYIQPQNIMTLLSLEALSRLDVGMW